MSNVASTGRPPTPWDSLALALQPRGEGLQGMLDALALSTTAMPGVGDVAGLAADGYRFATDPSSRTWGNAGWASLGLIPFVPAMGAVTRAAGKAADALDMSKDARMARAAEQGFDTSRTWYHGTSDSFDSFDVKRAGANTGSKQRAVFLTDKPGVADTYLPGGFVNGASENPTVKDMIGDGHEGVVRWYAPGGNVVPAYLPKLDGFEVWDMGGARYDPDFKAKALREAKKAKSKGVVFENIRDGGGMETGWGDPSTVVAVFNPKDVRSVHAAFDPAKRNSGDLLASLAAAGLFGGAAARLYDGEQ